MRGTNHIGSPGAVGGQSGGPDTASSGPERQHLFRPAGPPLATVDVSDDAERVDLQRPGHFEELNHIEPALALFDLGDEGLRAAQLLRQLDLGQARGPACFRQQATELCVLARKRRPGHPGSVLSEFGISQNGFIVVVDR